jgi:CDP-diacylglycerol--glycerol-3-phosphate 3-phosphatidyltransferase
VQRSAVGLRIHRDRADPELAQRPEDPDRDLAAVGDQDLRERHGRILSQQVSLPDQLTVARALSVPVVVVLYEWNFPNHDYWATALFIAAMSTDWFDGRIARRRGRTSSLGTLLDPVADKLLVLSVLITLIDQGVFPAWMVVAIVAREFLVSGLRLAALERGVVIAARDLGKLKTWSQAIAAAVGGFAAAGLWSDTYAWWALLVAVVLTWVSGLDYARVAPALLRKRAVA